MQRGVLLAQLGLMLAVVFGDADQQILERGQAVARLLREIGAAEERPLIVRRQEHRERPAARALRQHLLRDLIDAVDVGTLLAIDLDVDEQLDSTRAAVASSSKLSCASTWHQWHAE